jgi:hypothetical protein
METLVVRGGLFLVGGMPKSKNVHLSATSAHCDKMLDDEFEHC